MSKGYIPYNHPLTISEQDMLKRSGDFLDLMKQRRSVRYFSDKAVSMDLMENIIQTAGTAPSGANKQPWTFCLVSAPDVKRSIREAAEKEEYENYNGRMSEEWLRDLEPFGTDWHKDFLETAPWLIVVFKRSYNLEADGSKSKHYYVNESVGIACGMLISAIHYAGLVTLTHTPSPMNFLNNVLDRPENEKAFLLLPVGYPAADSQVPDIHRKSLEHILIKYT